MTILKTELIVTVHLMIIEHSPRVWVSRRLRFADLAPPSPVCNTALANPSLSCWPRLSSLTLTSLSTVLPFVLDAPWVWNVPLSILAALGLVSSPRLQFKHNHLSPRGIVSKTQPRGAIKSPHLSLLEPCLGSQWISGYAFTYLMLSGQSSLQRHRSHVY